MERDFRVRANLYFGKEGKARGLYNHVLGLKDEAVDINPGKPNAEMRYVAFDNHYFVTFDLCFPPDKEGVAQGLYNHAKNSKSEKAPDAVCFVELERCGHRIVARCDIVERFVVT